MYIKDSYLESKNIFQCVLCLYILPVVYFTISYCWGHTISWFSWKGTFSLATLMDPKVYTQTILKAYI